MWKRIVGWLAGMFGSPESTKREPFKDEAGQWWRWEKVIKTEQELMLEFMAVSGSYWLEMSVYPYKWIAVRTEPPA